VKETLMEPVVQQAMTTRERALARVLEYRERGRRRSPPARVALAALGAVLLLASVPAAVVLPELGVPALLVALRLLAVEADWAAKAYAWIDWRFSQSREWFRRQSRPIRAAVLAGLIVAAVALVWLLIDHLLS
jgi:hypothetical protein